MVLARVDMTFADMRDRLANAYREISALRAENLEVPAALAGCGACAVCFHYRLFLFHS